MIKLNKNTILNEEGDTPYVSFPVLNQFAFVKHGFSTRLGGVSCGIYESMNLGFNRGDLEENVYQNYQNICNSIKITADHLVFTDQVHQSEVRKATKADRGKGYNRVRDYAMIDAHITNESDVPLLVFSADCVPVYLVDPIKKAVGLAHAGWKGSVDMISLKTVESLKAEYGSLPKDITAVIGPSIGPCCYEVLKDTADAFLNAYTTEQSNDIIIRKPDSSIYIDLWRANYHALLAAGLQEKNIVISGMCTMCRQDLFFSHRAMGVKRGSMAGFISIL